MDIHDREPSHVAILITAPIRLRFLCMLPHLRQHYHSIRVLGPCHRVSRSSINCLAADVRLAFRLNFPSGVLERQVARNLPACILGVVERHIRRTASAYLKPRREIHPGLDYLLSFLSFPLSPTGSYPTRPHKVPTFNAPQHAGREVLPFPTTWSRSGAVRGQPYRKGSTLPDIRTGAEAAVLMGMAAVEWKILGGCLVQPRHAGVRRKVHPRQPNSGLVVGHLDTIDLNGHRARKLRRIIYSSFHFT